LFNAAKCPNLAGRTTNYLKASILFDVDKSFFKQSFMIMQLKKLNADMKIKQKNMYGKTMVKNLKAA
jgi:hypothetical protein